MTFCRAKSIGNVSEICQQFSGLINNTIAQLNKRFNTYNNLKTHRIAKRGLINIVGSFEKWACTRNQRPLHSGYGTNLRLNALFKII